jgi:Na+/H+ antiporter NhaD/arsenite permease-like protein
MEAAILVVFVLGYFCITLENSIQVNKAATALVTAVICWTLYICVTPDKHAVTEALAGHLGEIAGILFFLLGAMTIVELIDAHDGFELITSRIDRTDRRWLLWTISFLTFFLSAILDNLTTTIVMVSMLRKLIRQQNERILFAGLVVVAANAGGAWSPIGDVTTTMLWIGGQITAFSIIAKLILPSLACLVVPLVYLSWKLRGQVERPVSEAPAGKLFSKRHQLIVFGTGLLVLILLPVFKTMTGLPPFMGMLIGLGMLWVITEIMHGGREDKARNTLSVAHALQRIDTPSILFFLGILLSIASLEETGSLARLAGWMSATLRSDAAIAISIGLLSAVIDNVPLVAAAQGMYDLNQYPTDHYFWEFLAYCTGTGGSALIIGSAAGVAAMGMERISFFWYLRNISVLALMGYFAGAAVYILQHKLV